MDKSCIVKSRILCPWHHRRIDRILDFKDEITNIIPSIDFCVEKFQDKIKFITEMIHNITIQNHMKFLEKIK